MAIYLFAAGGIMPIYDLTVSITPKTIVFPGDPYFKSEKLMDVEKGDSFTLCHFGFGNHMGTHIDFPAHVISGGKCSSDYPLEYLLGTGRVIEIPDDSHVTAEHIEASEIKPGEIVFFKTRNTRDGLNDREVYTNDFAAIEPEAAVSLVKAGVKIVGIDYLSVDKVEDEDLPAHKMLLGNEVLVVENVNLTDVPPGEYSISICPLKVEQADGLPVRIIASTATIFAETASSAYTEAKKEYEANREHSRKTSISLG